MSDEVTDPNARPLREEPLVDIVQQELESIIPFTARVREAITELGEVVVLTARTFKRTVVPPWAFKEISYQIEMLGVRSLSMGGLIAIMVGLVLSLQFAFSLERFGIQHTV